MAAGHSFAGASGRHYDYVLLDPSTSALAPMQGGNFIFAKSAKNEPEIIHIGAAPSIQAVILNTRIWSEAQEKYGANQFFIHVGLDEAAREPEKADLLRKYHPPMNPTE